MKRITEMFVRGKDDSGVAMPVVLVVTVMLFVFAIMILTVVSQSTFQSVRRTGHAKAMHMADAGLNAYLYELRRNPSYYLSSPQLGPISLEDGSWVVTSTPPVGSTPLMLRATGRIPSMNETSVVVAAVRFPTYADYMFLTDAYIPIGSAATIKGKVRSNDYIRNDGKITGVAEAVNSITGSGTFGGGKRCPVPKVDFAQVTADLTDIRTAATAAGTYLAGSGAKGYRAVVSGNTVTVSKISVLNSTTGVMTLNTIGMYTIPHSGVMFFNDDVYVSGTYTEKLTIASSSSIYIVDNYEPANLNSTATSGLIGAQNVVVPTTFTSVPTIMRVTASLLAQNGQVYGTCISGVANNRKSKITILGSIGCKDFPYFESGGVGWASRLYDYDERLDIDPPPMFPQIRDGSLKISTWNEYK